MINSDQTEDVVFQTFKCYLKQGGSLCWLEMNKCSHNLLTFKISPGGLVLLEGRLFLAQGVPTGVD